MQRLADLVLRGRALVLAAVVILTALAAAGYSGLRVDNRIDAWFAPDDPQYLRYREFRARFLTEDLLYVVVGAADVFTRDVLGRIDRLTRRIAALPAVVRTVGLASIEDIRGTADGLEVGPLVPRLDLDDAALAALRARVLADPFLPGAIVSRDGRTTVVAVELGPPSAETTGATLDAIDAAVAEVARPGLTLHVAGWPSAGLLMDRLTQRDVARGFPLTIAILATCVGLAFRSGRVAALIVVVVMLAIVWTMGAFAALGFEGTFVTFSALPGILMPLAVATGVHVTARFGEEVARAPDRREAMGRALRAVAFPVVLTSATTAVGFGSLVVATVPPLRHLGLFAALGMAVICLLCLTLLPALLVAFPWRGRLAEHRWLDRALGWVAGVDARHARAIVALGLALAAVGTLGALRVRPQGSNLHYLPSGSPPVEAMHYVEEHFGGASELDVLVSGRAGQLKEPATTRTVAAIQALLRSYPEVTAAFAYTDLLRRMNQALHDGDPAHYRLPETRRGTAQQLLLYETSGGRDLSTFLDVSGYDVARVSARTTSFDELRAVERLHRDLERRLAALAPRDGAPLRLEIAGDAPLWLRQNLELLDTMADSTGLALVGISAMMIWLTRSVRVGLLAMIPNVIPVLLAIGLMGWSGIQLDFATVMIAAIALGIAVDDTIHYLARYRSELAAGLEAAAARRQALVTVGRAMVATSVVLCVGMLSMLTSSFPPHRTFGGVMALTITFALAGDLFLLPALLALGGGRWGERPDRPAGARAGGGRPPTNLSSAGRAAT